MVSVQQLSYLLVGVVAMMYSCFCHATDVFMLESMDGICLWSPYVIGRPYIFSCCGLFFFFFLMVALWNRVDHYIFILFLLSFFLLFFSSPNLSGRRLDVYHTLAPHGVALVRI